MCDVRAAAQCKGSTASSSTQQHRTEPCTVCHFESGRAVAWLCWSDSEHETMANGKSKNQKEVRDPDRFIAQDEIVDNRWQIVRVLGEGGFGAVYEVKDVKEPSAETYAMKVESVKAPVHEQVLKMDVNILRRLRAKHSQHFTKFVMAGKTDRMHYMVTSLVGPNLNDLKRRCKGKFRPRTVAHVAIGSLEGLKEMHEINYLHRDIKPPNLAIGRPPRYRELYLLDFGLCRQYRHDDDGRLRRPRERAGFRGTMRYASITCHRNEETSRADDLWSWLYVMIELTVGRLPWEDEMMQVRSLPLRDQIKRVGGVKESMNATPEELMNGCPVEFMDLQRHIATLAYHSDPDYDLLMQSLRKLEERRRQPLKDGDQLEWEEFLEAERQRSP